MSRGIRGCQAKLAEVLRDSGKSLDEAAQLYKVMLDFEIKVVGRNHPTVLLTAAEHARCLELKGSPNAADTYRRAYPILLKTWGEKDVDVKKVRSWIEAGRKTDDVKE